MKTTSIIVGLLAASSLVILSPHTADATTPNPAARPGLTYTATSATSGDIRDATG